MPPFMLTEAMVIAVAEAIKALAHAHEITVENMTPDQKVVQAQFFAEMMKGPMILMHGFNTWLEKQLEK